MRQSKLLQTLFPFMIMAIPWIYLAFIWQDLPDTIATHFGIDGKPDKFGPRNEILLITGVLSAVGILVYFLLKNIYRIDPKKKYSATTSSVLSKIAVVVILLLCAVTLFLLYWTLKGKTDGLPVFFCGMGLFLVYIGNLMHSIKPNYFAGFRVPWTLENEENWRKTHQLASKIWFIGGIVMSIISLLLNIKTLIIFFIAGIFVMTIIPLVYSYNLFRQSTKSARPD
ncbi:MAG TPA: SdpI family protein [Ferruginibacter sp.]|nr:SdpI family protein [Ferruginibacter sp.]